MSIGPEIRQPRVLAMFAGEIADRTRSLEDGILALQEVPSEERRPLLDELARHAHTLKGSAGLMGAQRLVTICHGLEDVLGALPTRGAIEPDVLTQLLDEVDRLRRVGAEMTGTTDDDTPEPAADREPRPTAAGTAVPPASPSSSASVRLPAHKLDRLVTGVAELRAATTSLSAASHGDRHLAPVVRGLDRAVAGIDRAVRDAVTVPVSETCDGLARVVRDIAHAQEKEVRLQLDVGDAEIDRRAVGVVRDALVHLVRNAADHGIELPGARRDAGKPPAGTIVVRAGVHGDRVAVSVIDDGRGIDEASVRAAADRVGAAPDGDAQELVFTAGLSTATVASDISGRGVGLDAVRDRVESLGGAVTLRSDAGRGTEVTLVVPASLATARVLLVEVAGERVALLTASVHRLVRVTGEDLVLSEGHAWLRRPDGLVPLLELAEVAELPGGDRERASDRRGRPAVMVETSTGTVTALLVDEVVGEQELMVQPVGTGLDRLPALVGAGVLASGQVVLLLHPAALVRSAGPRRATPTTLQLNGARGSRGRILLVEDAPTTRALEQGLLEAAGYEVVPAVDGRQGWNLLRQQAVDVVVTDIEMPEVDGIELCRRIRATPTLQELPVILVTSRGAEEDRRRGAEAGADAYLVKSSFAQGDLVAAIERALT